MTTPAHPPIPMSAGHPRCEIDGCDVPASHFWADLQEIAPIPALEADGTQRRDEINGGPVWYAQWEVASRHARCDDHPGEQVMTYLNGSTSVGGRTATFGDAPCPPSGSTTAWVSRPVQEVDVSPS